MKFLIFLTTRRGPWQAPGMATVNLTNITMPTPEPYDKQSPTKQQETFYYILNQILSAGKAAGWQIPDPVTLIPSANTPTVNVDVTELTQAVKDLAYTGQVLDLQSELGFLRLWISRQMTSVDVR